MRKLFLVGLLGLASVVCAHTAAATTAECVNCNESQMYSAARALGPSPSPHMVWNPATGAVRKYRNYCGTLNGVGPVTEGVSRAEARRQDPASVTAGCNLQTEEVPVDGETANVAAALSQIWLGTGGTMKQSVTANVSPMQFPAYLPRQPSAHDFLYDVQLRGEILRLASSPQIFQMTNNPLSGPITYILGHVDATMGFTSGIVLTIEIVFFDGSSVKLRATLNEQASYVANSAVDGTGQTLPDPTTNAPGYAGRWYYPPGTENDMVRFLEYMRQLGVTIQYGSGAGGGVIKCNWKPENNETICMVPH